MIIENQDLYRLPPIVSIPKTIEEAIEIKKQATEKVCFISGGTFLQIKWDQGVERPDHLISLEKIKELKCIEKILHGNKTFLKIGALSTLADCRSHPFIIEEWGMLSEAAKHIAAPAVRNRGTIGGNVVNGFGDIIPALLALDAELVFFTSDGENIMPLSDWVETKHSGLYETNSILTAILLPENTNGQKSNYFYKKVGRREAFTVSLVTVSGVYEMDEKGLINKVRIAVGGGEHIPCRLSYSEQLLLGRSLAEISWKELYSSIKEEFNANSDAFVSADYRRKVAANIIVSEFQG